MYLFFSAFFFRQKLTLRVFFRQKRQQKHRKTPPKSHVGWGISSHWFPKKLPSFSESSEAPNFCRPGDPHRKFISAKNTLGGGGVLKVCVCNAHCFCIFPRLFFFSFFGFCVLHFSNPSWCLGKLTQVRQENTPLGCRIVFGLCAGLSI